MSDQTPPEGPAPESTTPEPDTPAAAEPTDAGQAEVQARFDAINADGYLGTKVDPTPNEHYTIAGVLDDKPTPETTRTGRISQPHAEEATNV